MNQLREYLRRQYIGAIVIGLLAFQGVVGLVGVVASSSYLIFATRGTQSALGFRVGDQPFPWNSVMPRVVEAALYLVLAYVLVRWLYWPEVSDRESVIVEDGEPQI